MSLIPQHLEAPSTSEDSLCSAAGPTYFFSSWVVTLEAGAPVATIQSMFEAQFF